MTWGDKTHIKVIKLKSKYSSLDEWRILGIIKAYWEKSLEKKGKCELLARKVRIPIFKTSNTFLSATGLYKRESFQVPEQYSFYFVIFLHMVLLNHYLGESPKTIWYLFHGQIQRKR